MLNFTPAARHEHKARVAIIGPTGAGKTHTALEWARILAGPSGRVAVIDTENGSASLYADTFTFDTAPWGPPYDAAKLAAAIGQAAAKYDVLVLDSLTHFWQGDGGVLDVVEQEGARNRGNNFAGWKKGTPLWRGLVDAMIFAPCHVIVTMRSKMDYVQTVGNDGRARIEKMGMAPVARNDIEYEFTVVGELDTSHRLAITKSRCSALTDAVAAPHQAGKLAATFAAWLDSADPEPPSPPTPTPAPAQPRPVIAPSEDDGDPMATAAQITAMQAALTGLGIKDRDGKLARISAIVGRAVASSKELTRTEAGKVLDNLTNVEVVA